MDRSIMEGNPHSVIEGMMIAALAAVACTMSLAACGGKDRFECKISEGEKKKNA